MPEYKKIELPAGLDWPTVEKGVEIIQAWEVEGDGDAELVIQLYALFRNPSSAT